MMIFNAPKENESSAIDFQGKCILYVSQCWKHSIVHNDVAYTLHGVSLSCINDFVRKAPESLPFS